MQDSFLTYRRFRYLKLSTLLTAACIVIYALDKSANGHNGGTWAGYTLGTIGTLIILLLLWLGVRKRRFHSALGNVRGWLSAHVYLGLALAVIVTLHTGFQFGWNVHSVAYAFMLLVIVSGVYGTWMYARYPDVVTHNRDGLSPETMLDNISDLEQRCLQLAESIDQETYQMVLGSVQRARIGGGVLRQLRSRAAHGNTRRERSMDQVLLRKSARAAAQVKGTASAPMDGAQAGMTLRAMAGQLAGAAPGKQVDTMRELMELMGRKRALVNCLNRDIGLRAHMHIWLYVHIPLSVGLLAALIAHIVSVFFYW